MNLGTGQGGNELLQLPLHLDVTTQFKILETRKPSGVQGYCESYFH